MYTNKNDMINIIHNQNNIIEFNNIKNRELQNKIDELELQIINLQNEIRKMKTN